MATRALLMSPPQWLPDADAMIAEDLNQMSLEERERAIFDVHGVSDAVAETEEMVVRSLAEFEDNIARIRNKEAYHIAELQNEAYVANRNLRLKFLRSANFDVSFSAKKMVRYLDIKRELFGSEKLTKNITLHDLNKDDIACLESGVCQILPLRDRAGRAILCWTVQFRGDCSLESRVRTLWVCVLRGACPCSFHHINLLVFFSSVIPFWGYYISFEFFGIAVWSWPTTERRKSVDPLLCCWAMAVAAS